MMPPRKAAWLLAPIFLVHVAPFGVSPASAKERAVAADALDAPAGQGSTRTLYLSLIRQARIDGRARAALAYLDDFDRQHPRDRDALVLRINCLLDLGQTEAAQNALSRVPPNARDGEVLEVRGHLAAAQGDWALAAREYGSALEASPADPLVGNALGYAQMRAGLWQQAVESLKAAHDLAPGEAVIRNNLALALTVAGRSAEAEALLGTIRDSGTRAKVRREVAGEAERLAPPPVAEVGADHG